MANRFDFLPLDVAIFLDSSVIGRQTYRHQDPDLADEISRIKDLTEKLSCMTNWAAIPQVIEEQTRNVDRLKNVLSKRKKLHNPAEDYLRLMKTKRRFRNLLIFRMENSQILTPQLAERARTMYPGIKASFYRNDKKINDLETDIHVLANVLAYAQLNQNQDTEIKTCVWAYDHGIIDTLKEVASKWEIPIGRLFETSPRIIPVYGVLKSPDVVIPATTNPAS